MITRKVAPALAAGCTAVVKPAAETPLTAKLLLDLAHEAGVPTDVLSLVTVSNAGVEPVGEALATDPRFRKLSFTGSTPVAKWLAQRAAGTLKRVSIEAGGNAPFVVFPDADLGSAVSGFMASKFRNAGQTCVCANRVFVHRSVLDAFSDGVREATDALARKQGHAFAEGVEIGPLIRSDRVDHMRELLADALSSGAKILSGNEDGTPEPLLEGEGPSASGLDASAFFRPTIAVAESIEAGREMKACQGEIFGPLAVIQPFESEAEALHAANSTDAGLAAYFYTQDVNRAWRFAEGLEAGMVGVNTGLISSSSAPFGGVKESGYGREGGLEGLSEFTETKAITMGGMRE